MELPRELCPWYAGGGGGEVPDSSGINISDSAYRDRTDVYRIGLPLCEGSLPQSALGDSALPGMAGRGGGAGGV
jgi:hypothetical protein